jgi:hypothetical protein
MSTKTTFKRVALVAVAALSLGVLSVAPSQASIAADSLTLSATTAAITTADTATATSATLRFAGTADIDSISVIADFVSGPAVFKPYLVLAETSSVTIDGVAAPAAGRVVYPSETTTVLSKSSTEFVSAKWNIVLASPTDITKAATTAGTYVIKLTPKAQGSGVLVGSAAQTLTITVTTSTTLVTTASAAFSTSFIASGETITATADATILGARAASSSVAAASIVVTQKNAVNATANESMTATISGPGTLGAGATSLQSAPTVSSIASTGRSLVVKNGDIIQVFPDGTSGTGTITISSASGVVLGTETVTFYGDIAAVVASVSIPVIKVGSTAAVVTAFGYDASGNVVPGDNLYAYSSDNTIIDTTNYVKSGASSTTAATLGRATFTLTGVKAGTASIRVGLATSATDVTTTGFAIKSDAVSVRVGGSQSELADVLVSFDKLNYAPGSVAYVTIQPVDKAGAVLAAGETYTVFSAAVTGTAVLAGLTPSMPVTSVTAAAQISSPSAWTGNPPVALTATAVQVRAGSYSATADTTLVPAGAYTYRMVLPVTQGDFTLTYSLATMPGNTANSGAARSITATISDPGSQAAVDAAAEATDAANAATDAALAAADAADAATAAAEDASAAVAKLSKSVTTALNNLKKQITSLTALVNKLLKR